MLGFLESFYGLFGKRKKNEKKKSLLKLEYSSNVDKVLDNMELVVFILLDILVLIGILMFIIYMIYEMKFYYEITFLFLLFFLFLLITRYFSGKLDYKVEFLDVGIRYPRLRLVGMFAEVYNSLIYYEEFKYYKCESLKNKITLYSKSFFDANFVLRDLSKVEYEKVLRLLIQKKIDEK